MFSKEFWFTILGIFIFFLLTTLAVYIYANCIKTQIIVSSIITNNYRDKQDLKKLDDKLKEMEKIIFELHDNLTKQNENSIMIEEKINGMENNFLKIRKTYLNYTLFNSKNQERF